MSEGAAAAVGSFDKVPTPSLDQCLRHEDQEHRKEEIMGEPWPSGRDYQSAMQNPKFAFVEPHLQQCEIANRDGWPKVIAGGFAAVYKAMAPNGDNWAVKVFHRRSAERQARYVVVCKYLDQHHLRSIVKLSYEDAGIKVLVKDRPAKFPLIIMEWIHGQTLQMFARERCRNSDGQALERCAERWVELVRELANARIAHGDLQHGNVMVNESGELKLVDYDCMGVPALEGLPTLEGGLPPYQHHARNGDTALFAELDRFSTIFIYVALKVLAAAPHLWSEFVEPLDGTDRPIRESLLFETSDFVAPQDSELVHALRKHQNQHLGRLTDGLIACWNLPRLQAIPSLNQFLAEHATEAPASMANGT